jgi:hypothetical protein
MRNATVKAVSETFVTLDPVAFSELRVIIASDEFRDNGVPTDLTAKRRSVGAPFRFLGVMREA